MSDDQFVQIEMVHSTMVSLEETGIVLASCRSILEEYYGQRLKGLVLYGSIARSRADATSDVDLLVLLDEPFDYFLELRQIVDLLYPVQLVSERLISAKPASSAAFETGAVSFYRNARRDGVPV